MINCFHDKYAFLSNFYPARVEYQLNFYPTVEHAYQASKVSAISRRVDFQTAKTPGIAKRMGQRVQLRPDWERVKLNVMQDLLVSKFSDPELKALLLATGKEMLVEGNNWHDNIWGDCGCSRCKNIPGQNWLGELLMMVRYFHRESN